MRLLAVIIIFIVGTVLILITLTIVNLNSKRGVLVSPNESIITAQVLDYHSSNHITIRVLTSRQVEEHKIDFGKGKIGKEVTVYSWEEISHELVGKKIRAHFMKWGDERGSAYWIWKIEVIDH
jgi:hypothetical protein